MNDDGSGFVERVLADGRHDRLVREEPLLLRIGDQDLLTMRTPGADPDLALGFLLGEGVLREPGELCDLRAVPAVPERGEPDTLVLTLAEGAHAQARGRLTRTHEIRSSCGLCGLGSVEALLDELPALLPGVPRIDRALVDHCRIEFTRRQRLFDATGACHAAALFTARGEVIGHGEDVGRHNALDKAVGAAARGGHELAQAIAMLSGRAGFDLVLKCLRVRIPVILSVSAPSAPSHDLCTQAGATLIGFVRPGRAQVYCDSGRVAGGLG